MAETAILDADLLVVGGGMIGLTLGIAAAGAGLRVALVERQAPGDVTAAAFDGRVSSIAAGSQAMFQALGIWRHMARQAEPILDIRVSDGASPLYLHFDHHDVGERPFGFMVENRFIRIALHHAAGETGNLTLLMPRAVESLDCGGARVLARLDDGRTVRAALAVAADGRASPLREAAGIRAIAWRYPQTAIVCTIRHELPHHGVAKEHFLPSGPFALLPMQGKRSSLVWTETEALAPVMLSLDDRAFDAEIQARAGGHLGRVTAERPRWRYPLGLQNAERYIDRRLALVGDAAHAMHPLAGQGLNLGLRDVAWLAQAVVEAARLGLDIGGADVLERYQRNRRWDALTMLVMTDGLNRLFSNAVPPLRLVRDLGLGLVNAVGLAKHFFERRASAMAGDLPRLIRGEAL